MFLVILRNMGYLSKGYYTICLSPVVSIILYYIISSLFHGRDLIEFLQRLLIGEVIPTIGIQVCGIVLCLLGWALHESMPMGIVHKIANIILLLLGMLVTFINWFQYGLAVSHPQLIIHSEMEFHVTSALMGLLWIASGLFFIYIGWRSSKVVS
jgi:hypothetical protein